MNKFSVTTWLAAQISRFLPGPLLGSGRKTPRYRRQWKTFAPWLSGALIAPFAVFLVSKAANLFRRRRER